MSCFLICDYEARDVNILPGVWIGQGECECCGASTLSLKLTWLFWGAGISIEVGG